MTNNHYSYQQWLKRTKLPDKYEYHLAWCAAWDEQERRYREHREILVDANERIIELEKENLKLRRQK